MFSVMNRFLLFVSIGAVAALIGMGWWLNLTIESKAILEAKAATQEVAITALQEDAVDKERIIVANKEIQKDIVAYMINTTNEIEELQRENPNTCYTTTIPDPILKRLWGDSSKDRVYQAPNEPSTTE